MGYLVAIHITKDRPNVEAIRSTLPTSIGFNVYVNPSLNLYAIDTFKASKIPKYPFCTVTPATDIALDLGPTLDNAYSSLRETGSANGFKRAYAKLAEMLSASLEQAVLTICSDDDDSDFACIAHNGRVLDLLASTESREIAFINGELTIDALVTEKSLHRNASILFEKFSGSSASSIGLGSFDAPLNLGFVDS